MARTYYCASCGRRLKPRDVAAGRTIYSSHTGNRYCPATDDRACRRRAAANRRRAARQTAASVDTITPDHREVRKGATP